MNWFSRLKRIFAGDVTPDQLNDPNLWVGGDGVGRETTSGERVSPELSLTISAYYAAMRAISEDVAKLPLIVYRRLTPRGKDRMPEHPLFPLLHDAPNDQMSAMSWRETVGAHALGWGNGYSEIERDGAGRVLALWPIHPSRVQVKRQGRFDIVYEIRIDDFDAAGLNHGYSVVRLKPDRVFHVHGLGGDGLTGYSIARIAAESLGLTIATQRFGAAFFGNGASVSGVLEHPEKLGDEAYARIRESWERVHRGPMNANRIAILEEGMKFSKTSIPPEEAQFLQSRKFQVEEIARWFRIPPHKIQSLDKATYSNIEMQSLEYVGDTLMPWLVRWEQEIKRKLILESELDIFAEHLVNGLMRGDSKARGEYYGKQLQNGAMSPNDIREAENMNPIENGDKYFIPVNLMALDQVGKEPVEAPAPPASEEPEEGPEDESEDLPEKEPKEDAVAAVFHGLVVEELGRLSRKEAKAVESAMSAPTLDAFAAKMLRFFASHQRHMRANLYPIIDGYARLILAGPVGDRIDKAIEGLVRQAHLQNIAAYQDKSPGGRSLDLRAEAQNLLEIVNHADTAEAS